MQLQAGKRYLTRDGRKTGKLSEFHKDYQCFLGTVEGEKGFHRWNPDGKYYQFGHTSRFDLVGESTESKMISKDDVLEWVNLRINDLEQFNKLASFPEAMSNDACITELKALKAKIESL